MTNSEIQMKVERCHNSLITSGDYLGALWGFEDSKGRIDTIPVQMSPRRISPAVKFSSPSYRLVNLPETLSSWKFVPADKRIPDRIEPKSSKWQEECANI